MDADLAVRIVQLGPHAVERLTFARLEAEKRGQTVDRKVEAAEPLPRVPLSPESSDPKFSYSGSVIARFPCECGCGCEDERTVAHRAACRECAFGNHAPS